MSTRERSNDPITTAHEFTFEGQPKTERNRYEDPQGDNSND